MPAEWLLDAGRRRSEMRQILGAPTEVPYFDIAGHHVWGATAMILAELCQVLRASRGGDG